VTPVVILAFAATVLLDVAGQLAFKLGLNVPRQGPLWRRVLASPATLAGVAAYGLELVLWLVVLSVADLSVAYPAAALAYGGVLLASRIVLGEPVSRRRWLGAGIITLGVALVCASA
jgi:drug/metabolite transporter (DMT)-like permease